MSWTPEPDRGPGAEILGDITGQPVLELGCGPGHQLAHLVAFQHAIGIGVDAAPAQILRANSHYGHLRRIEFVCADAIGFLAGTSTRFQACYSIFGAAGHTPPDKLLAGISSRLLLGGVLAFSVRTAAHGGRDAHLGPDEDKLLLPDGTLALSTGGI